MAKGSLFLGRMSQSSDGMSVMIEANPGLGGARTRTAQTETAKQA